MRTVHFTLNSAVRAAFPAQAMDPIDLMDPMDLTRRVKVHFVHKVNTVQGMTNNLLGF